MVRKHWVVLGVGVAAGSPAALAGSYALAAYLGIDAKIRASLVPTSFNTTPCRVAREPGKGMQSQLNRPCRWPATTAGAKGALSQITRRASLNITLTRAKNELLTYCRGRAMVL
ncbi:hypothetical protein [Stenotrophomonas maltophilia]|uniref:hypothetical protein n=1 Tax=Stenotrophomonas maltophilia TaxID=40324 RepID=UPI003CFC7C1D